MLEILVRWLKAFAKTLMLLAWGSIVVIGAVAGAFVAISVWVEIAAHYQLLAGGSDPEFWIGLFLTLVVTFAGIALGASCGVFVAYGSAFELSRLLWRFRRTRKLSCTLSQEVFGVPNVTKRDLVSLLWEQTPLPESLRNLLYN